MLLTSLSKTNRAAAIILRTLHRMDSDADGTISLAEFTARASRDELLMRALESIFEVQQNYKVTLAEVSTKVEDARKAKTRAEKRQEAEKKAEERARDARVKMASDVAKEGPPKMSPGKKAAERRASTSKKGANPGHTGARSPRKGSVTGSPRRGSNTGALPNIGERHASPRDTQDGSNMSYLLATKYRKRIAEAPGPTYDPATDSLKHKDGTTSVRRLGSFRHAANGSATKPSVSPRRPAARRQHAAAEATGKLPASPRARAALHGNTSNALDVLMPTSHSGSHAHRPNITGSVRLVDHEKGTLALNRTVGPESWSPVKRPEPARMSPRANGYLRLKPASDTASNAAFGRKATRREQTARSVVNERSARAGKVVHHPAAAKHGLLTTAGKTSLKQDASRSAAPIWQ